MRRIFYNSSCLGCFLMVQIPYLTEPQMPVYEVKAVLSCLNWNFTQQHQTELNTPHYWDGGHTSTFWRQEVVKSKESSQEASMGRKFLSLEHLAVSQRCEGNKVVGDYACTERCVPWQALRDGLKDCPGLRSFFFYLPLCLSV